MNESTTGRIIFSNNRRQIEKNLSGRNRPVRYLILDEGEKHSGIRDYLGLLSNCEEIDCPAETKNLRPSFLTDFIDLISGLNQANKSLSWWALYFTRKEIAYTKFAEKIFNCLLVRNVVRQSPSSDNIIVTSDTLLAKQMGDWAATQGFQHIKALTVGWQIKARLKNFIAGRMVLTLLKAIHYWSMLRLFARVSVTKGDNYIVVGSLIEERCFSGDGGYTDTYLGELPEFMAQNGGHVLVYGGMVNDLRSTLRAIRKTKSSLPILPWHYYGTLSGILQASWLALSRYFSPLRLEGHLEIDGVSVDRLINEEIRINYRTGHYFNSLWLHYSAKALSKHIKVSAFIMPYENRSWEKMLLKGFTQDGNPVNTVGYHHAALSPAHTHMFLGKDEAEVLPLPNKIVMTGEITKAILEKNGNYPEHMLEVGCSLRRGRDVGTTHLRNKAGKITNVLVALARSDDEYIDTLNFLDEALSGDASYQIGIRPHPDVSLDRSLAQLPDLRLRFERMGASLESNFDWADVVVYVSSTVGLQAVSIGLPAVSIDLGKFTSYDPAPEDCPLKWSVSDPDQLVPAFQRIDDLSGPDYEFLQAKASESGSQYFHPVTDGKLRTLANLLSANGTS